MSFKRFDRRGLGSPLSHHQYGGKVRYKSVNGFDQVSTCNVLRNSISFQIQISGLLLMSMDSRVPWQKFDVAWC